MGEVLPWPLQCRSTKMPRLSQKCGAFWRTQSMKWFSFRESFKQTFKRVTKPNRNLCSKSQDEALTKDRRMVRVWSSKCADASPQDPTQNVGRNFFETWGERALFASDAGAGALGFVIKKPTMEVFWIWFYQAMLRCRWKISQLSAKSYCRQFRLFWVSMRHYQNGDFLGPLLGLQKRRTWFWCLAGRGSGPSSAFRWKGMRELNQQKRTWLLLPNRSA